MIVLHRAKNAKVFSREADMLFTQFLFPKGKRQTVVIDMPPEIETKAEELQQSGWSFEIECSPDTQMVHMDCGDGDEPIASRICQNGPDVPVKVAELVNTAHEAWIRQGKPKAY
jgi:hypothetical protein